MYLGLELLGIEDCARRANKAKPLRVVALETIAELGVEPCSDEMLEEVLVLPLLPGSAQLSLQHSRAIETAGALLEDCALLQQSGMPAIEPSLSCTSAPTTPPIRAPMRAKAVSHLRIVVTILRGLVQCQACRVLGSAPLDCCCQDRIAKLNLRYCKC
jgi:hypothetical protein